MRAPRASWLVLGTVLALSGSASAQNSTDKATADARFEQGRKLMADGNFAQACPKFAESQRLDGGIGTMLRLADCYEKNGQIASAWAQFREAAQVAARASDNREKVARRRATDLESTLPKLAITLAPQAQVPGMVIKRDGEAVGIATLGIEIPIDPGLHSITVSAPGKATWTTSIDVAATSGASSVTIPALADFTGAGMVTPTPAGTAAARSDVPGAEDDKVSRSDNDSAPAANDGSTQRTIALVTGGVGIVSIGIGVIFGLNAKSDLDASNADNHCRADNQCDQTGFDLRSTYKDEATISTIGFVAGSVALAGAAVLWFTAPKGATRVGLTPAASAHAAGLTLRGLW